MAKSRFRHDCRATMARRGLNLSDFVNRFVGRTGTVRCTIREGRPNEEVLVDFGRRDLWIPATCLELTRADAERREPAP